ncbi:hypothetical protein M431DRAFT_259194 [Trichoderma harzianum CBS 226.95]|uniref:Uncharacterized protein n=1 Tax=Trichoderma harzianum CBS 226.95 TaxID=983964 RepID=A0A2T3ZYY7_TRIHA|nr:hypothetical protein M431DRAFT_259194 [Trichoderma harzianum CBS 226.95]PTB50031.1 hypothetical protein M431DRAFT_259194 [Trichoderma harzianum CBS 226.95]
MVRKICWHCLGISSSACGLPTEVFSFLTYLLPPANSAPLLLGCLVPMPANDSKSVILGSR